MLVFITGSTRYSEEQRAAIDELLGDYFSAQRLKHGPLKRKTLTDITIKEFLVWTQQQAIEPDTLPEDS